MTSIINCTWNDVAFLILQASRHILHAENPEKNFFFAVSADSEI